MLPKNEHIEKFVSQASTLFDDIVGANTKEKVKGDVEASLRALAQKTLGSLDVVSREEFDGQTEVLARTQQKIAQMEKQLDELLEQLAKK